MTRAATRSRLSRVVAVSASVCALFVGSVLPTSAAGELAIQFTGDPAAGMLGSVEQTMLDLTNADRIANGLSPLAFDPETILIARERAASQLGTSSLSHYDADGNLAFVGLLGSSHVSYAMAGENLARVSAPDATVAPRVENALMMSPTHRKNILEGTFHRVAIGAATDGNGQIALAEVYRD